MQIDRYLKDGVWKSIVHVIKQANFQLYRVHLTTLFRKPDNWQQIYEQTSLTFYASNEEKIISTS